MFIFAKLSWVKTNTRQGTEYFIVVPYELYDWGKVPELYGTLYWTWNFMELYEYAHLVDRICSVGYAEDSVQWTTDNAEAEETDSQSV